MILVLLLVVQLITHHLCGMHAQFTSKVEYKKNCRDLEHCLKYVRSQNQLLREQLHTLNEENAFLKNQGKVKELTERNDALEKDNIVLIRRILSLTEANDSLNENNNFLATYIYDMISGYITDFLADNDYRYISTNNSVFIKTLPYCSNKELYNSLTKRIEVEKQKRKNAFSDAAYTFATFSILSVSCVPFLLKKDPPLKISFGASLLMGCGLIMGSTSYFINKADNAKKYADMAYKLAQHVKLNEVGESNINT